MEKTAFQLGKSGLRMGKVPFGWEKVPSRGKSVLALQPSLPAAAVVARSSPVMSFIFDGKTSQGVLMRVPPEKLRTPPPVMSCTSDGNKWQGGGNCRLLCKILDFHPLPPDRGS